MLKLNHYIKFLSVIPIFDDFKKSIQRGMIKATRILYHSNW